MMMPPVSRVVAPVLVVLLVALMLVGLKTPVNVYDEGNILTASQRILAGEVPYRDFWGVYPPGQLIAVAGVLSVFGENVMGPRLYDVLVRCLTVLVAFLLARQLGGRRLALVTAWIFAVTLAAVGRHFVYPVQPAFLLALTALGVWLAGLRAETSRGLRLGYLAGALLGLGALVRWDIAGYAAAGLLAATAVAALSPRSGAARRAPGVALRGAAASIAVAGTGYLATALWAGPGQLWDQVFWFPATELHAARGLALPKPWELELNPASIWAQFYAPILILAAMCLGLGLLLRRRWHSLSAEHAAAVALLVFGLASFSQALSRTDRSHLIPTTLVAVLALVALLGQHRDLSVWLRRLLGAALIAATLMYSYIGLRVIVRDALRFPPSACLSSVSHASCVALPADQQAAVRYVRSVTAQGEPVFVANTQNQRINVNDSSFYFLADRPPATAYEELHPGVADTAEVQREIVEDLRQAAVRWVVLVQMPDSSEPNLSSRGFGTSVLDDHLRSSYVLRETFGNYQVLQAR